MQTKMDLALLLIFYVIGASAEESDWTKECNKCKCMWVAGRKSADCSNVGLGNIPTDFSTSIREFDFSNNLLYDLGKEVFLKANLRDTHKLKFQNCSIEVFHETTFNGLSLLIELDLSRNAIKRLNKNVFRDNTRLRVLLLSYNRISVLEDGLLHNLTYLQRVTFDHNQITAITENTFVNLPALHHINLAYNKIKTVTFDLKSQLPKLNSLNVEANPWICDCNLREFRYSTITHNLITTRTECKEPPRLRGREWTDPEVQFACSPEIIDPLPSTQIEATTYNITLTCKVAGDPQPDVDWVINGRIVDRDPRQNKQKFITFKSKTGQYTWNNLTITNVNYRDRGEYKCIAKNPGGEDERNVTLIVYSNGLGFGSSPTPFGNSVPWIIGVTVTLVVILVIILILICCFCKRSTHGLNSKRRDVDDGAEEFISMRGGPTDMKKGLITDVNPVCKPPRTTLPTTMNSGGTEVSDAKKTLLDSDSVFECDDESRSLEYEQPLLRKSQQLLLESDYRLNHPSYPPDLLSFPPRASQVSPAGSSASTVADTTRLPPHHGPQSPLHSPLYDTNLYRTLPYSRSHSPFVGPVPRIPRQGQGYVTIPRRPRQSWSSEPPSSSDIPAEPLYDNLGIRTTVDGSSALSLNKLGNADAASTPRSNRMFPMTSPCDPIAEHESTSPNTNATNHSQTLPRNMMKINAPARRAELSPERRNSTTSLPSNSITPSNPPVKKIPPQPPPKPPKKPAAGKEVLQTTWPLFEDEGEHGTEV